MDSEEEPDDARRTAYTYVYELNKRTRERELEVRPCGLPWSAVARALAGL